MKWSQGTEVGLIRKRNEDSICVIPDLAFFAVADGMGGHLAGEVASRMALESVAGELRAVKKNGLEKKLLKGVRAANSNVYEASQKDSSCRGMGTTLTAAVIKDREMTLAHVGDSRAYIIRGDKIFSLTEDHSLVHEMLKQGGITREQAREHPHRNVLTRALGTDPSVEVDIIKTTLEEGDFVLLCSDGLSGLVEDHQIKGLVKSAPGPEQAVRDLIQEALGRGGNDNISVIVVEIDE
ncbi:MAG: Stp1/IreP family PP2C-type Ser/Thr phosphatase [Actinobacteria bacterium]|nr:Stp1/IreP family PP2C-type Ser/Thr phosphatase [Actinomycetota bacterium]